MNDWEVIVSFIAAISGLFAAGVGIWKHYQSRNTELAQKKLYAVYFPVFRRLEKHMYKMVDSHNFNKDIAKAYGIVMENKVLVSPRMCALFTVYMEETNKNKKVEVYKKLCTEIIDRYSDARHQVGLGYLTPFYKRKMKLFKTPLHMIGGYLVVTVKILALTYYLVLFLLVMLIIMQKLL